MFRGLALVCVVGCAEATSSVTPAVDQSTIVSLTFDDTLADQAQVAAMANARGMHVTFFVNSPRFDHAGYLALSDVLAFQAAGHEIAGHTLHHIDLTTLTLADATHEVCDDRVALLADGLAARMFAYPHGGTSAAVEQIVADCGYSGGRDVGGLVSTGSCQTCPYSDPVPPDPVFDIRTAGVVTIDTTLDDLERDVLQAEQHGGGWAPIVFHHVCDGCSSLSVSPATLAAFLDWLAARGTAVKRFGDVIGGSREVVLQNPSLELDANNDQIPDCWQRGGSGTNTATFSLESPGFDGNTAQRIDVTSLSSGARRLAIRQDQGACAPSAAPGHRYVVTAAYTSTTQPHFTAYVRDAAGTWSFLAQGPALPASATYVRGSYTTPPYPAGATAISVGLSILAVGSLTMDAFTLEDVGP